MYTYEFIKFIIKSDLIVQFDLSSTLYAFSYLSSLSTTLRYLKSASMKVSSFLYFTYNFICSKSM